MTTSSQTFHQRLLLNLLAVSALTTSSHAAISVTSLGNRNLGFYEAVSEPLRILLDFIPGTESSFLWLDPSPYVSGTSWLISQGAIRVVNSRGLVRPQTPAASSARISNCQQYGMREKPVPTTHPHCRTMAMIAIMCSRKGGFPRRLPSFTKMKPTSVSNLNSTD
jgi:hypothetical protein